MDAAKAIVLQTFPNTTAAGLAASQLRGHGIECLITSDDCGGMYPPLGLVKLLVDPADADAARDCLEVAAIIPEPATESLQGGDSAEPKAPPPRVLRFNSGLVVGVILGALLYFIYTQHEKYRDRTDRYYEEQRGVLEQEVVWRNGKMVESRWDRNGDGRWDEWTFYQNGLPWRGEADDNFDGRVDAWVAYSPRGFVSRIELDTDYNGIRDVVTAYTNGIRMQADWRPNGTNVVLLRQIFRQSVLREELRDVNGDGWFDVRVQFDSFSTPIATNLPNNFSAPPK